MILEPARFFRDLDLRRSSGGAVLFAVICLVVDEVLLQIAAPLDPLVPNAGYPSWPWLGWAIAVASLPLVAWIFPYIVAAFQHLCVMVFVRPGKNFDATLRVNAHVSAIGLLSWVPNLGRLASAYVLYVTMLGIRELHGTTTKRASLTVLVPLLVLLASTAWSLWPVS